MTPLERNQQLTARFQIIQDHLTHADPNDFDTQIPPTLVSCDADTQTVIYSFDMKPNFSNPHGMGHGGIIAAMLDCAQGATIAGFCDDHPHIVTVSLQTSYLRPVLLGQPLFVKVVIQKLGGHIAYCSAEAWQEKGKIAVTCSGVYHIVRNSQQKD